LIDVSHGLGIETDAVITRMDDPIGKYVGNALEVVEAIDTLAGRGPEDSVEIICVLGAQLLLATGKASSRGEGVEMVKEQLFSGKALDNFSEMAKASNADRDSVDDLCNLSNTPHDFLSKSETVTELTVQRNGFVERIKAMPIATVSNELGAGRAR